MTFHPLLAIATPEIIILVVVAGALLFGADKIPKLARSFGQAKREFTAGQIEADEASIRMREEARLRAQREHADLMDNVETGGMTGEPIPPPTPGKGTPSG